jgi:hypothetical protein
VSAPCRCAKRAASCVNLGCGCRLHTLRIPRLWGERARHVPNARHPPTPETYEFSSMPLG